jgi:RimJ/RimL family protein N-acetyltransferase
MEDSQKMAETDKMRVRRDVRLEPLGQCHAEDVYRWMTDPIISANIGLRTDPSLPKTREWIAKATQDPTIRAFAVLWNGVHVGNAVLDQIDAYLSKARFSIYIGEAHARASGIGTTGTFLILQVAFRELGLYKVWLTVHSRNDRAIKAYSRVGFQLEGILRGEFLLNGERLSVWYMSIVVEEFRKIASTF